MLLNYVHSCMGNQVLCGLYVQVLVTVFFCGDMYTHGVADLTLGMYITRHNNYSQPTTYSTKIEENDFNRHHGVNLHHVGFH